MFKKRNIGLPDAITSVKDSSSNYLKLPRSLKSDKDILKTLVDSNRMIIPHVISDFIKSAHKSESVSIDTIMDLIKDAIKHEPAVFPFILTGFIGKPVADIMIEKMKTEHKYPIPWVTHIPPALRNFKFMEEAVTANPKLMMEKNDPYWDTEDGKKLKKKQGFRERSNSLRKIISGTFDRFYQGKEE